MKGSDATHFQGAPCAATTLPRVPSPSARATTPLARKEKQETEQRAARTVSHIVSVIIKVEKPEQFHVKMHENAGNKTNDWS